MVTMASRPDFSRTSLCNATDFRVTLTLSDGGLQNPYQELPSRQFWRTGVAERPADARDLHTPKWQISKTDAFVTMGSCFAQHITEHLKSAGLTLPQYEHANDHLEGGFNAHYGNIYTAAHLRQLLEECAGLREISSSWWPLENGYIDPIRPGVFIKPFSSIEEVLNSRRHHLDMTNQALKDMDTFIFTLGLTEGWKMKSCDRILPVAPGVIAGEYSSASYEFVNFTIDEVISDLSSTLDILKKIRSGRPVKILLTVSPIPLTATHENRHILSSTFASKATLRTACEEICRGQDLIDYFPSYEIATDPKYSGSAFEKNLRNLTPSTIARVMGHFSSAYLSRETTPIPTLEEHLLETKGSVDCEDALLETFSYQRSEDEPSSDANILFFGDSHLGFLRNALTDPRLRDASAFVPINFLEKDPFENIQREKFRSFSFTEPLFPAVNATAASLLVLVGVGLFGDNILRCFGNMRDGFPGCNGSDISPDLPNELTDSPRIKSIFRKSISEKLSILKPILRFGEFNSIIWIVAPDPPEKVARFRFGDAFVDSGVFREMQAIYEETFSELSRAWPDVTFIQHSDHLKDSNTGFTLNTFARTSPWDLHPDSDFYHGLAQDLESSFIQSIT